ncbi:MAG TPA: sterol desaturase family protein [Cyclobacteriaceae bacterium]|nr:sterol desaturase family protein [Cyclobacteriaceae bacterium]
MESTIDKIPENLRPRTTATGQLFSNRLIESLTRTHISIPVTLHLLIVAVVSYYALERHTLLNFSFLFVAGTLTWTLAEYGVHRFVYHTKTKNKLWLKIQYLGHGIHHQYPKDPTRLAMPPLPALVLITGFFGLFWVLMQQYAIAFFPGFLFGYVLYISMHYAEHKIKSPLYGPFKRLWKYHALHHYKYPETKAFGVSTILWDWVFGTLPPLGGKS